MRESTHSAAGPATLGRNSPGRARNWDSYPSPETGFLGQTRPFGLTSSIRDSEIKIAKPEVKKTRKIRVSYEKTTQNHCHTGDIARPNCRYLPASEPCGQDFGPSRRTCSRRKGQSRVENNRNPHRRTEWLTLQYGQDAGACHKRSKSVCSVSYESATQAASAFDDRWQRRRTERRPNIAQFRSARCCPSRRA